MLTVEFTLRAPDVRTLILLRHAKSDYPIGVPDHDRPLSPRGRKDAPAAGAWLTQHCPPIDRALVSSAVRAQQTWDLASVPCDTVTEPRIYEAAATVLVNLVVDLPDDLQTVVFVGHNPGLEDLAHALTRGGDAAARQRLALKYPTSGVAVLQCDGTWLDLAAGADLVDFAVPRG